MAASSLQTRVYIKLDYLLIKNTMRKKGNGLVNIASVLGQSSNALGLKGTIKYYKIWACWEGIAGKTIAAHARPARWQGHTLIVRVDHSSWMQELNLLKPQIMAKIEEALPRGGPKKIRFELGELPEAPPKDTSVTAALPPLNEEEKEFIDRAANQIADPTIRQAAHRAMERGFRRGRKR